MKWLKCLVQRDKSEIIEHTSRKKGLCKRKVRVLHFFVLQIRGYCVDLREHIELKFWSVGLPFGEMFLALVMPFFTMK